jgi:hypothetical protein
MTGKSPHPLPVQGGSYTRAKDGSLIPVEVPTNPEPPEVPGIEEGVKAPVKEG